MRHARTDYDRIQDPSGKIPEKEPVFLLRGQDLAAPATLRHYATTAHAMGASPDLVASVLAHARDMEEWQRRIARKVADMPSDATPELGVDEIAVTAVRFIPCGAAYLVAPSVMTVDMVTLGRSAGISGIAPCNIEEGQRCAFSARKGVLRVLGGKP